MSAAHDRIEAEALAGALPATLLEARRLAAGAPGLHGRRRAGQGEAFWQFRDHTREDGMRAVDWRRSARGDRLYVREREREAAQTLLFWLDDDPGFAWRSLESAPTKRRRALTLCLAAAIAVGRAGERVGALGGPAPRSGEQAIPRLADALWRSNGPPGATPPRCAAVFASDFYEDPAVWSERLARAAGRGVSGALLMVSDPAEDDFPFRGRTQFEALTGGARPIVFGRAERARDEYKARLTAQRDAIRRVAHAHGFVPVLHRTDHGAAPALAALLDSLRERR